MEGSSEKDPVLIQSERKLKQATLPFEIVKTSLCKRSKLSTSNSQLTCKQDGVQCDDDSVEILEVKRKEEPSQENVENENIPKEVHEVVLQRLRDIPYSANVTNVVENKDDRTTINIVNDISDEMKMEEDTAKGNKRKFDINGKTKEQKPCKRAKLIYHVDKLKKGDVGVTTTKDQDSVSACKEPVVEEFEPYLERTKSESGNNLMLQEKCSVNCLSLKSNVDVEVINLEKDDFEVKTENSPNPNANHGRNSNSEKTFVKKLTPKQLQRRAEIAKKREELLQEKERKKKEKVRMKQEKEEAKVRLKQEKQEVKKKLKEEKEKKKQAVIELKNEEKRKKEEEKRKKEEQKLEDKRKKEEQKLEDKRKKEELQRKKEEEEELLKKKITKEAEAFSSFFKKYDVKTTVAREEEKSSNEVVFMPFTVKADMRIAPINRNPMDEERRSKFEESYNDQSCVDTYLVEFRSGILVPKKSRNTWPLEEKYDVVVLDEGLDLKDETTTVPQKRFNDRRPKLLQFYENRRPPYWGTWRKISRSIRPKNPFGKDEIFDYEVDSDDEWEEEEPGESLHGSDDEKESEDEYEVDNDFFVPHGYLSDDENPEDEIISPETQKAKLKLLGEQFDMERNEKTKLLKPITLGCVWFDSEADEPDSVNPAVVRFLNKRKAVPWTDNLPIFLNQDENMDPCEATLSDGGTPTSTRKGAFPEASIPDLIALIHGSTNSRKNLAKVFISQWIKKEEDKDGETEGMTHTLSQARVAKKIKELSKWEEFPEEGPFYGRKCWYVKKEVREKYGVVNLPLPIKEDVDVDNSKKMSPPLITKFTKVLTEDERKSQMTARKSVSTPKPLSDATPNFPKPQVAVKCARKLEQFWAKPSLHSKYFVGVSVSTEDANVDNADDSANPDGIKSTVPEDVTKSEAENADVEMVEVVTPKSDIESVSNGSNQETKTSPKENAAKPTARKRVAILYSAPRGCPIVRPEVAPKKTTVSIDDVVKKYENAGEKEEIGGETN